MRPEHSGVSATALPEKTIKFGFIPKLRSALMRQVRVPTVVFSACPASGIMDKIGLFRADNRTFAGAHIANIRSP